MFNLRNTNNSMTKLRIASAAAIVVAAVLAVFLACGCSGGAGQDQKSGAGSSPDATASEAPSEAESSVYVLAKITRHQSDMTRTMFFDYDEQGNISHIYEDESGYWDHLLELDEDGFPVAVDEDADGETDYNYTNTFNDSGLLTKATRDDLEVGSYEFSYRDDETLEGFRYEYGDLHLDETGLPEACYGFGSDGNVITLSWERDSAGTPTSCTVEVASDYGEFSPWRLQVTTDGAGNITTITDERGSGTCSFEYAKIDNPSRATRSLIAPYTTSTYVLSALIGHTIDYGYLYTWPI